MSKSPFHSKIYNEFKTIETHAHRSIVEFYTKYENDIQRLKFHEYFELQVSYIDALFEIAAYENLLETCDETIVAVIENNIQYHHGEDIYRKLLLRKAAAHYNLLEYHKAEFILKELIKINPKDGYVIRFFRKSKIQHPPTYVQYSRGVSLLLFLFTAMIICFEMSYFGFGQEPNAMGVLIEISRNVVFLSGWFVLILGDGIFRFSVWKETEDWVEEVKLKKNQLEDVPVLSKK